MKLEDILKRELDSIGDDHHSSNQENPIREDAFDVSDAEKIKLIEVKVRDILEILGMDLTDDSLKGTPLRVAKMYVNEVFGGLNPKKKPIPSTFDNKYKYGEMLVEKNITLYSTCEHHLLPIIGFAHVAYVSNGTVVGLSKINRVVNYYSKRPQVQERLTIQIAKTLMSALDAKGVAVTIDAAHQCMTMRGIKKEKATTVTNYFLGSFKEDLSIQNRYLKYIGK